MTRRRKPWELKESELTDESLYLDRRRFLKALGLGGLAAAGLALGGRRLVEEARAAELDELLAKLPQLEGQANPLYKDVGRPLTKLPDPLTYNNFYEFSFTKNVWPHSKDFELDPYSLEVTGLVGKPGELSLEQVEKLGLEERIYRFRCVEAWAMTVPWIGVPLRKLMEHVEVKPEAKYVAFLSFLDPKQAPNQNKASGYTWPYYEALSIEEAKQDLSLIATGIYGRRLPPQSGAPLRLVTPWKYGYKSPKSVIRMTFTKERPPTFWNDAQPREYSWLSNVEPDVPHPRWSQRTERVLGQAGVTRPSLLYNGYAEQVAGLYKKQKG